MKKAAGKEKLSTDLRDELLATLEDRFTNNMKRHQGLEWSDIAKRLKSNQSKLTSVDSIPNASQAVEIQYIILSRFFIKLFFRLCDLLQPVMGHIDTLGKGQLQQLVAV